MNDPFAGLSNGTYPTQTAPNPYASFQQNGQPHPQQPAANDNPFATYNNVQQQQPYAQQQQAIVQNAQQTNQWSMQPQQQQPPYQTNHMQGMGFHQHSSPQVVQQGGYQPQQHMMTPQQQTQQGMVPSSNQSIASSNYMTPGMHPGSTQSQNKTMMMTPGVPNHTQQQLFSPGQAQLQQQNVNVYQNAYIQQQQQQQQQQRQQQQQQSVAPAPVTTRPEAAKNDDEDFFGVFSNNVKKKQQRSPRPPSEFETDNNESVSVLSKSTNETGRHSTGASPFDDPKFAPKPQKPQGLDNARALAHNAPPGSSPLPDFDLVTHSGYALARISFRTILIKKWKQIFWITYGVNKLLVFRSSADFEDWVSNPYLNSAQREFLVKLQIDLVNDLGKKNVRGYQLTNQRLKAYSNKML